MNEIKKIFTKELLVLGFKRNKDWYFKNNELTIVINIQKSNYGMHYFLNIGVWFNEISDEFEFPKEFKCHLRFRSEDLFSNIPEELSPINILNLEKEDKNRIEKVEKFLKEYFCPALRVFMDITSICKMYNEGKLSYALIKKEVIEICQKRGM